MKRKRWLAIFQIIAGVLILTLVFSAIEDRAELARALKRLKNNWHFMAASLLVCLVGFFACALRWKLLLDAQQIHPSFPTVLRLLFIGHFYNAFLFGSNGGDIVRAVMISKHYPGKRTEAFTSVFVDRMIGIFTLFVFGTFIILIRWKLFFSNKGSSIVGVAMLSFTLVASAALFLMFRRNLFERYRWLGKLRSETMLGSLFSRAYCAFHLCISHRGLFIRSMALSLTNHLLLAVCAMIGAFAIGVRTTPAPLPDSAANNVLASAASPLQTETVSAPFLPHNLTVAAQEAFNYASIAPICNGISSLPLTPGGIGTREAMFQLLLGLPPFGVPAAEALVVSLLLAATMLVWSAFGGLVYALDVLCNVTKHKKRTR